MSQYHEAIEVSPYESTKRKHCTHCEERTTWVRRGDEWYCSEDHTTPSDGQETLISDGGEIYRGDQTTSCHLDPICLVRDDDELKVRYLEGSGIIRPSGDIITITRVPDDAGPGLAGYGKLTIRPHELDDYITVLQKIRDEIEDPEVSDGAE